jgi:hypothetical protein
MRLNSCKTVIPSEESTARGLARIREVFLGLPKAHIRGAETNDVLVSFQELSDPSAKNRPQEDIGVKNQPLCERSSTPAGPPP